MANQYIFDLRTIYCENQLMTSLQMLTKAKTGLAGDIINTSQEFSDLRKQITHHNTLKKMSRIKQHKCVFSWHSNKLNDHSVK